MKDHIQLPPTTSSWPPRILRHADLSVRRHVDTAESTRPPRSFRRTMAILHGCPGVKVTIVSTGQALNEYPDEDMAFNNEDYSVPLSRRAMAYIECTSDTEFGIKWQITPEYKPDVPHTHLRFRTFLDGKRMGGDTIKTSPSSSWSTTMSDTRDRINDHEIILRKLIFKTIKKGT
jgi:hypothetical protein